MQKNIKSPTKVQAELKEWHHGRLTRIISWNRCTMLCLKWLQRSNYEPHLGSPLDCWWLKARCLLFTHMFSNCVGQRFINSYSCGPSSPRNSGVRPGLQLGGAGGSGVPDQKSKYFTLLPIFNITRVRKNMCLPWLTNHLVAALCLAMDPHLKQQKPVIHQREYSWTIEEISQYLWIAVRSTRLEKNKDNVPYSYGDIPPQYNICQIIIDYYYRSLPTLLLFIVNKIKWWCLWINWELLL